MERQRGAEIQFSLHEGRPRHGGARSKTQTTPGHETASRSTVPEDVGA